MPKRSYTRRLWSPEEDEVVDRYARKLAGGRYRNVSDAARACAQGIKRLYASLRRVDPHHHVASRQRPFRSIWQRLSDRMQALGLRRAGMRLTPPEEKVVARYVRGLVQGRYYDARQAATACAEELTRLAGTVARTHPFSLRTVQRRIYSRARRLKQPWGHTQWSAADGVTVERYARAVADGRYATARLAARACHREMARNQGRRISTRPFHAVLARLGELTRAMGVHKYPRWLETEERQYRRYLRLLFEGRYRRVRDAADACAAEMSRQDRDVRERTAAAVYTRMNHDVSKFGLPRYKGESTDEELRLCEKYAREVAAGTYDSAQLAAEACHRELSRMGSRWPKQTALGVRRIIPRPARAIHSQILAASARLGLQFPGRRWQPAEERIFEGWLRWYDRHHHIRRLEPLREAANGLSEDLAKKGFRRTVCACHERLVTTRRERPRTSAFRGNK